MCALSDRTALIYPSKKLSNGASSLKNVSITNRAPRRKPVMKVSSSDSPVSSALALQKRRNKILVLAGELFREQEPADPTLFLLNVITRLCDHTTLLTKNASSLF